MPDSSLLTSLHQRDTVDAHRVVCIVLAGGQGARLFPLTMHRCKPSVPFGGRFSIIDVPLSNAIRAHIRRIFVMTQFRGGSLSRHIAQHYRMDAFDPGFVHVLGPEQRDSGPVIAFDGTADAIRKNLEYLLDQPADYFLILSGDQLYNLDLGAMVRFARHSDADLTVGVIPVTKKEAGRMGVLKVDHHANIVDFYEKPRDAATLERFHNRTDTLRRMGLPAVTKRNYLASMGIYVFKRKALLDLLAEDPREDFGKHLIPTQVKKGKAAAYLYSGYWEDVGTVESFYEANMALTKPNPPFDCYDPARPIFVAACQHVPGAKIRGTNVVHSIISEGSLVAAKKVLHSILGTRSVVGEGTVIKRSYIVGNDAYDHPAVPEGQAAPTLGIGKRCLIDKAIIDKNVSIGDDVRLVNKKEIDHYDGPNVYIRDGIIVVPAGVVIPSGFVL